MQLAMLDVGHGVGVVLTDGNRAVLIDVPPGPVVLRYLRAKTVTAIEHVLITHADRDHIGGLVGLLHSGIVVERLWFLDDQLNRTKTYTDLQTSLRRARRAGRVTPRRSPHADEEPAPFGARARVEWLAPYPEERMGRGNRNRLSVVARIVVDEHGVVLVPGDIDEIGYRALLEDGREHQADWLIVPHHGGDCGGEEANKRLMQQLLARTRAKHAFVSFGRNDGYDLPRREVVEALAGGAQVRCSQLSRHCAGDDDLHEGSDAFQHKISAGRLRRGGACCAGTIELDLAGGTDWDQAVNHERLKTALKGIPLCRDTSSGASVP